MDTTGLTRLCNTVYKVHKITPEEGRTLLLGPETCWVKSLIVCLVLPCASQPPAAPAGEGAERIYGVDVTNYRCPNGYMWQTGPFLVTLTE